MSDIKPFGNDLATTEGKIAETRQLILKAINEAGTRRVHDLTHLYNLTFNNRFGLTKEQVQSGFSAEELLQQFLLAILEKTQILAAQQIISPGSTPLTVASQIPVGTYTPPNL